MEAGPPFYLAMHDLKSRRAGEVLLKRFAEARWRKSDFSPYIDMLNHAVCSLKAGKEPDLEGRCTRPSRSGCMRPPLLPDDYTDVHERRVLVASVFSNCEPEPVGEAGELVDRLAAARPGTVAGRDAPAAPAG